MAFLSQYLEYRYEKGEGDAGKDEPDGFRNFRGTKQEQHFAEIDRIAESRIGARRDKGGRCSVGQNGSAVAEQRFDRRCDEYDARNTETDADPMRGSIVEAGPRQGPE